MGPESDKIFKSFALTREQEHDFDVVLQKFEEHFIPKINVIYERSKFYTRNQSQGESVEEFVRALYQLSENCRFHDRNEMIRDRIVIGLLDKEVCQKLQLKDDLTLDKAVELARSHELIKKQNCQPPVPVDALRKSKKFPSSRSNSNFKATGISKKKSQDSQRICERCGSQEQGHKTCPAFGKICKKCGKQNHFAKMCRTRLSPTTRAKQIHMLEEDTAWVGAVDHDQYDVDSINSPTAWYVGVNMLGQTVRMKVDTGAQANVIPLGMWKQLKTTPALQPSTTTLRSVDNRIIVNEGMAQVTMSSGPISAKDYIFVTKNGSQAILGLKSSIALGLVSPGKNGDNLHIQEITTTSLQEEFKVVFSGLGCYADEYHIQLKEGAEPVIQPPRRVPHILYEDLKRKLNDMQENQVITPVDQPTKWVNSLVIAKKADGSLRLCLDPRELNKNIEREHFEISTFEQVVSGLGGKSIFTTLDQKDSYWQVKLDHESSLLTTFNTPFGHHRFLRMPFGISSASEILQKNTYKVFGDIPNVHCLSDDMLIATATQEEHDFTIRKVMERAKECGVKFNPKKIQMKQSEITYMGRKISADGIQPDPAKVEAVIEMPQPEDVKGVQRLLGMVNFMSPFIPNMSTITSPLRDLLKKDVPWNGSHEQTNAVNKLKQILSREPVLKLYNSSKPTTIQCDSSSTGLGACLLQEGQPIAYASRSLTDTEKNCAQIEKEMLSIFIAAEHFHQYI